MGDFKLSQFSVDKAGSKSGRPRSGGAAQALRVVTERRLIERTSSFGFTL